MVEKWTPNGTQNCPKIDPGAQNAVPEARQVAIFQDFSSHHRFSTFFMDFRGKINEKTEKMEFLVFRNDQKPPGMSRIDRIGCTSGHCEPNEGSMEVQWGPMGSH